jgi:hypothetical protein
MKNFAVALLAVSVAARGTSGGINQGYANPSFGATHGYGYNEGNDYIAGDSHGHTLDVRAHGAADDYAYDVKNYFETNTHMWGYDSVKSTEGADAVNTALLEDLSAALDAVQLEREDKINEELTKRIIRLADAFEDHQAKAEAPFIYQDDMLLKEIDDIRVAMSNAEEDQDDAFADLIERMADFKNAKILEYESETDKIVRALDRAVRDFKQVDEVFYAMRIDWLQGVSIHGTRAVWTDDVWDMKSQMDGTFDMFTFDIGKGKGHGHTTTRGIENDRETGFVVGRGGSGDISTLQGEPVARDGVRRRYDRQTQNGHGAPNRPSDYAVGNEANRARGVYNYNQAADLRIEDQTRRPSRGAPRRAPPRRRAPPSTTQVRRSRPTRRAPPRGAPERRPTQSRPTQAPPAARRPYGI